MEAAQKGDVEEVKHVLDKGVDVNTSYAAVTCAPSKLHVITRIIRRAHTLPHVVALIRIIIRF